MKIEYVPLLSLQREIYAIPRGRERFETYLRTIMDRDGTTVELMPLIAMNPMARDHVPALLDALLALDADRVGRRAAADAEAALADVPGEHPAALVVVDDLKGGWTNRAAVEFELRFGPADPRRRPALDRRTVWITGILWSSEPAGERAAREAVLAAAHRLAYLKRCGPARTLRERLAQEGRVLAAAGCAGPTLDDDDREYTRTVLAPLLDAADVRTAVECLFGDEAARTLGFTPRGLSRWAGLALALHDARLEAAALT
jgi:hypothetical protein